MTVVLLDPTQPDAIPVAAAPLLRGHVYVTEEVNTHVLWGVKTFDFVGDGSGVPFDTTIITTDLENPAVKERLAHSDQLIRTHPVAGGELLKAVDLMDRLRRSGPWERQQTHDSLRRYLVEEVYELLDAFDSNDSAEIKSELGDLLLQVLFNARIAQDSASDPFTIDDVARSFIDKVSYRTPGVLAGDHADLERQIKEWEDAKARERNRGSVLDGIVTSQPALALTQKLLERLAAANFPDSVISPSLTRVDVPFRKQSRDSVEDVQRRRALMLMEQVAVAERAAVVDGVLPRDEKTWRKYLGVEEDLGDEFTVVEAYTDEDDENGDGSTPLGDDSSPLVEPVEANRAPTDEDIDDAADYAAVVDAPAPASDFAGSSDVTGDVRPVDAFPDVDDFPAPPEPDPEPEKVPFDPYQAGGLRPIEVSVPKRVPRMVVKKSDD